MIPFFRRNGRLMLAGIAVSLFCFALSALFTAQSAVPTGSWGLSFRTEGQPPIGNATAAALRNYDAVYVGDTQGDMEASEQAGLPFVWAAYGFGKPAHWDKRIDHFTDLLRL